MKTISKNLPEYVLWTDKTWSNIGDNNTHAVLGLYSEIGELADVFKKKHYGRKLDLVNLKEELGDICYYLARVIRTNSLDIKAINIEDVHVNKSIIECIDYIYYNIHVIQVASLFLPKSENAIKTIFNVVKMIGLEYQIDFEDVLKSNINKLSTRYSQGKFSDEQSANRDLDAENKALTSNEPENTTESN